MARVWLKGGSGLLVIIKCSENLAITGLEVFVEAVEGTEVVGVGNCNLCIVCSSPQNIEHVD